MRLLEPVIWAKGTVLKPQHLQIQDRFFEESLNFRLRALNFRPWGVLTLRIDREALAAGLFSITEASGMFPDGLLFDIPASDSAPPPRPLADQFAQDQTSLNIYLAVPAYRQGGINVAGEGRDLDARYNARVALLRDENTGIAEREVMLARKNFRVIVEGENREGSTCLQIAVVHKTEAGLFQLEPRFVPPLLDIAANDYVMSVARRIVEILTAKSGSLSASRRQKNQSLADFGAADIANFWLLYTINTSLPTFRHIFETRGGHPEVFYSALLELAGSLTTFSLKVHPRDLPVYDHDNLGPKLIKLDEQLQFLLDTVVPTNTVSLPLKLVGSSIYATSIDRDDYFENTRMFFAISAQTPQLGEQVPQLVKICSHDYIEHLVQRAIPGLPLTHVTPPPAIQVKMNYQYFSLEQRGGPWEAIKRARNLAAYVPGDIANPEMELIILLPESR